MLCSTLCPNLLLRPIDGNPQVDVEDQEFEEEFLSKEDPSMLHFLLASGEEVGAHAAASILHSAMHSEGLSKIESGIISLLRLVIPGSDGINEGVLWSQSLQKSPRWERTDLSKLPSAATWPVHGQRFKFRCRSPVNS